jgi:hypothetical protein
MEKEFIPYTEALALKELGFDEPCFKVVEGGPTDIFPYEKLDVPIYQQAFRWFRKKHELLSWTFTPFGVSNGYFWEIVNLSNIVIEGGFSSGQSGQFNTYEEAELACLEKLIEIVEQKEKYD